MADDTYDEDDDSAGWTMYDIIGHLPGMDPRAQREVMESVARAVGPKVALEVLLPADNDSVQRVATLARLRDLKARHEAERMFRESLQPAEEVVARLVDGGGFIHDLPPEVPAIWGHESQVVWMEGESLLLSGPPGVGKTTLAGQVVRARLVGGKVLDMEVTPTGSRVLYLAMDRPKQIARALHRMLGDVPRDVLNARLTVWEGPPPNDVAEHPGTLLEMAQQVGADTIVVDSLKDAAIGLEDSRVGAGYNRARQNCLAHGIELLELHHAVKRGTDGAPPNRLEHVFGSAWITAGAGSVVSLHGQGGDPVVQWRHLKQPAEEVGPFYVQHDHAAGVSQVYGAVDPVAQARAAGDAGITAKGLAVVMFEKPKPTTAEVAKARRRLDALVSAGELERIDGDAGTQQPTRWVSAGRGAGVDFADEPDERDLI